MKGKLVIILTSIGISIILFNQCSEGRGLCKVQRLEKNVKRLEKEIEKLKKTKINLEEQLKRQEFKIKELETANKELVSANKDLVSTVKKKDEIILDLEKELYSLKERLAKYNEYILEKDKEIVSLSKKLRYSKSEGQKYLNTVYFLSFTILSSIFAINTIK